MGRGSTVHASDVVKEIHETSVDDSFTCMHTLSMGRPKQFDERIQLPLVEGTTGRIDALLEEGEYRLDFIRTAIEAEIDKRSTKPVGAKDRLRRLMDAASRPKRS